MVGQKLGIQTETQNAEKQNAGNITAERSKVCYIIFCSTIRWHILVHIWRKWWMRGHLVHLVGQ